MRHDKLLQSVITITLCPRGEPVRRHPACHTSSEHRVSGSRCGTEYLLNRRGRTSTCGRPERVAVEHQRGGDRGATRGFQGEGRLSCKTRWWRGDAERRSRRAARLDWRRSRTWERGRRPGAAELVEENGGENGAGGRAVASQGRECAVRVVRGPKIRWKGGATDTRRSRNDDPAPALQKRGSRMWCGSSDEGCGRSGTLPRTRFRVGPWGPGSVLRTARCVRTRGLVRPSSGGATGEAAGRVRGGVRAHLKAMAVDAGVCRGDERDEADEWCRARIVSRRDAVHLLTEGPRRSQTEAARAGDGCEQPSSTSTTTHAVTAKAGTAHLCNERYTATDEPGEGSADDVGCFPAVGRRVPVRSGRASGTWRSWALGGGAVRVGPRSARTGDGRETLTRCGRTAESPGPAREQAPRRWRSRSTWPIRDCRSCGAGLRRRPKFRATTRSWCSLDTRGAPLQAI